MEEKGMIKEKMEPHSRKEKGNTFDERGE